MVIPSLGFIGIKLEMSSKRYINLLFHVEQEKVMEKISIEKIRCFHPLSFYACWMVVLWWMTMSIVTWGYCPLLDLIGLMGFGAIFLMIAGTFGTVSGKKVFLCNVYDGVAKYYKKVLGYEALILLLSLGLAFDMSFVSNNGYNPFSIYSWGGILIYVVAVFICIFLAKRISELLLERYSGRIINLCTDVILLPNLLVLVVFSGCHDLAKLLVILLVYHFL
jgi:hypothetical protein